MGAALVAEHMGEHDSDDLRSEDFQRSYFLLKAEKIHQGVEVIKNKLAEFGILSRSQIATMDHRAKKWETVFPEAKT